MQKCIGEKRTESKDAQSSLRLNVVLSCSAPYKLHTTSRKWNLHPMASLGKYFVGFRFIGRDISSLFFLADANELCYAARLFKQTSEPSEQWMLPKHAMHNVIERNSLCMRANQSLKKKSDLEITKISNRLDLGKWTFGRQLTVQKSPCAKIQQHSSLSKLIAIVVLLASI